MTTIPGALDAVKQQWRVDKTISGQSLVLLLLTLLSATLVNIVTAVWFARGFVEKTETLAADAVADRARITNLESAYRIEAREKLISDGKMAVLENRAVTTEAAVLRVEADVKKLLERR